MTTTVNAKEVMVHLKEYDCVDGCTQCVQSDYYPATWLGSMEKTVRNLLAGGDYSDGDGETRYVEVFIDGRWHGTYTAARIRRFRHRPGTL